MCGIAGILEFNGDTSPGNGIIGRMCAVMHHRGPDDYGEYCAEGIALGMRRLSIIDVENGHQPIANEDRSIWTVFNGEIYNHATLREQLVARGHRFSSRTDTEVIVHLYEEYGRGCVQHLEGMFAFAIWDSRARTLFLARDRLGIKPLYYALDSDFFVFGSEIKVVLKHPKISAQFNRSGLPEYLAFGYLSGEATFYSGIRKLMPGHWLEVDCNRKLRIEEYWDLVLYGERVLGNEDFYLRTYGEALENAVVSHLMSDVPLGVLLSGGLDSSAIAALTARHVGTPIRTFSVGYAEQEHSELPYARTVAKQLKSIHHEVLLTGKDFFNTLPKLIWHEDEPLVWPSSVPLYFVAELARRQHVKVVLTGEGSDETLAGYTRYAFTLKNMVLDRAYRNWVPGGIRRQFREWALNARWISGVVRRRLSHTFVARDGESWASLYFDNFFSAFSENEQKSLLKEDVSREFAPGASYHNVLHYWEKSSGDMLQRLLYTDIKTYLVELLMKQDNMSMAASIESRVPFLDHALVQVALHVPRNQVLEGIAGKKILKKAMEGLLPDSIIYRQKQGFPTPWSQWLSGPHLESVRSQLLNGNSVAKELFRSTTLEQLFSQHRAQSHDHSTRIWRLLNLELWHRVCIQDEPYELVQQGPANLHTCSA